MKDSRERFEAVVVEPVAWMRTDPPISWHRSFIAGSAKPRDENNTYNYPLYSAAQLKEVELRAYESAAEICRLKYIDARKKVMTGEEYQECWHAIRKLKEE